MKKICSLLLVLLLAVPLLSGCATKPVATEEKVTLTLCGAWSFFKAAESAAQAFQKLYPNCTIQYEYVQNYNESIVTRLENSPETVDLMIAGGLQQGSAMQPYALELFSQSGLDLSGTNPALIKNFTLKNTDPGAAAEIYSIPMGGELRGVYVNKTLLTSVGLDVPKNVTELLAACQTLKEAGYIAMHGNPGVFGQRLLYPYVCNLVANAEDYAATYARVNSCEAGVSELFRKPMQLLYDMMANYYYNYKYVETEYNMFTDLSNEGIARSFFNVVQSGDDYVKLDDVGKVAFVSGTLTQQSSMEKIKADYHSTIDYEFVLAPVGEEGGYAYVSPGQGIAINKNGKNVEWAVKFLNFLFSKEENLTFATEMGYIPNTVDSFAVIEKTFDVPMDRISDLGQATFDYDFYTVINDAMTTISKGNNPKYMKTDESGNTELYPFDYYMEQLEAAFAAQRESRAE